jgi:translation initiation factor 2 subunit 1
MELECNIHRKDFPDVGDIVVVKVNEIADSYVYVSLLEYSSIPGMLVMSELSRKFIKSLRKVIHVNKLDVVKVINTDVEKRYIDLSKKILDPFEIELHLNRWSKNKKAYSLMKQFSMKHDIPVKRLYEDFGWTLDESYESLYDGLVTSLENNDIYDSLPYKTDWLDHLQKKLNESVTHEYIFNLQTPQYDGVHIIKNLLQETMDIFEVNITLVSPPLYRITFLNNKEILDQAIDYIKKRSTELELLFTL